MRPFVERLVSFLTVLLAAFAMAQLAGAQTLPDTWAPKSELSEPRENIACVARLEPDGSGAARLHGVAGGP